MRKAQCLDVENKKCFEKAFNNFRELKAFMIKCHHSKKIKVIGFDYDGEQEYLELSKYQW
jgi:hypothetical protein